VQCHVPGANTSLSTIQERGKKRKHDEARGKVSAASEPCEEGRKQVVETKTAGAREESVRACKASP
jgi:hypothetical protein